MSILPAQSESVYPRVIEERCSVLCPLYVSLIPEARGVRCVEAIALEQFFNVSRLVKAERTHLLVNGNPENLFHLPQVLNLETLSEQFLVFLHHIEIIPDQTHIINRL